MILVSKRGRPYKKTLTPDYGTPELQRKKIMLAGKASRAHLSSTIPGILYARKYLTELDYDICTFFLKLTWDVKKIIDSPTLSQMDIKLAGLYGRNPQKKTIKPILSLENEIELKKLTLYNAILTSLKKLDTQDVKISLDLIQYNVAPPSILKFCENNHKRLPSNKDLKALKRIIRFIRREFMKGDQWATQKLPYLHSQERH